MKTKFYLSLSDNNGCCRMTSNDSSQISEIWQNMLKTFTEAGARLMTFQKGRFVVQMDNGNLKECQYGKYQFEDADPYPMAIQL